MKKLIFILAILFVFGCTKIDNTPIEIQKIERGKDYIEITFEVKREVDLNIRQQGLFPSFQHYQKGVYGYLGDNKLTVFDYEYGKLIVE